MRMTREQASTYSQGGSSYFKLGDGETAKVRFLYNSIEEITYEGVHEVNTPDGQYARISCGRLPSDPMDNCKWCQQGSRPVSRVVIPLFNLQSNEIQYWVRTQSYVDETLIPALQGIPQGQPIPGQTFTVKRTGQQLQTKYSIVVDMTMPNDGKTKTSFGEVKDPYEINIIRETSYEFPVANNNTQNNQNFTATRRTNNVF